MNLAQQGLAAYQRSQCKFCCASRSRRSMIDTFVFLADVSKTGGSEYNSPDNSGQDDHRYGPNSE